MAIAEARITGMHRSGLIQMLVDWCNANPYLTLILPKPHNLP
ncbi:hypothetical protein NVV93_16245 [Pseudomonas sp. LS44]|nr:hypothetical protein [Pseudomonas sp. LS44]UVE17118.1 hypothetical protein NVV93_16245 [Pseudomonas sp. LS44]